MADVGTVHVQCPDCGTPVPMTLHTRGMTSRNNVLQLAVEADYTDFWAHSWTHDDP